MTSNQRVAKGFAIGLAIFIMVIIGSAILGVVLAISGGMGGVFDDSTELVDFAADFEQVESLSIQSGMAGLTVKEGDTFRVEAIDVPDFFTAEVKSGVLTVNIGDGSQGFISNLFNWIDSDSMRIVVTVPTGFSANRIYIDSGSGGAKIENLQASVMEIDSGSGRLTAQNLTADDMRLDTSSGSVSLDNLDAVALSFYGGSGGIDIRKVTANKAELDFASGGATVIEASFGDLSLDSSSGRVSIAGSFEGNVDVDSGSGNVALNISQPEESYHFDFDSGSGGIWLGGNKIDDYKLGDRNRPYSFIINGGSGRVTVDFSR